MPKNRRPPCRQHHCHTSKRVPSSAPLPTRRRTSGQAPSSVLPPTCHQASKRAPLHLAADSSSHQQASTTFRPATHLSLCQQASTVVCLAADSSSRQRASTVVRPAANLSSCQQASTAPPCCRLVVAPANKHRSAPLLTPCCASKRAPPYDLWRKEDGGCGVPRSESHHASYSNLSNKKDYVCCVEY